MRQVDRRVDGDGGLDREGILPAYRAVPVRPGAARGPDRQGRSRRMPDADDPGKIQRIPLCQGAPVVDRRADTGERRRPAAADVLAAVPDVPGCGPALRKITGTKA